ncbi:MULTISPECIES: hypothetical protein [unclassified Kaistella]|uniref:hypothetical protein n=1 Tax=unclassified Kaistella TaxID=2762626 RepID=UPI002734D58D|nr:MULTISPECIES: hypothetical protein [unclassified Kaistella]MDP2453011.1 hypothetical protein [Kaistella sp. SH11-4b]MDP2455920.1 hypothetical protein [Kaistella sp. SH40-3]MDP2458824.1 hypothetical protein [Kaistella sp. SH19-2b]
MKDFDIEKLKRENVFTQPNGFYEDMQSNVLQKVKPVSRGKIINLNWAYGAAAAVALLVGVSVVMNQDPIVETQSITKVVPTTNSLPNDKIQKEEVVALQTLEKDLTSIEQTHPKESTKSDMISKKGNVSFADQKNQKTTQNPEVQVDQILASFTSAELADVGRNTEQDIYLDLYN